jgi:CheY-like chemotaxis protein
MAKPRYDRVVAPHTVTDLGPSEPSSVLRVLIVDDNVDSAEMMQVLLGSMGHDAQLAHDGKSALALVETQRPQVVLLDIGLPDMDGYEVARQMRARQQGPMRLIALTGWSQDEARERARAAGFDHHLTKPTDPEALERLLSEAAL